MLDRLTIERMAAKAGDGPILVALSGGGDSVALLYLLRAEFGAERLRAIVVDHALRQGSSDDAWRAYEIAEAVNVAAILHPIDWKGDPKRGHDAAREARYRALCDSARTCNGRVVVTGHTRDDQAETVLLRASRGSGVRGLSGMRAWAPMPVWPQGRGLWLARPLLGVRRGELRRYLQDFVDPFAPPFWIEDPANLDRTYARVRARNTLEVLEDDRGCDPMRLAELAERLAPYADAIDEAAYQLIDRCGDFDEDAIGVAPPFWDSDAEIRRRALGALFTAAGAQQRPPNADQVTAFEAAARSPDFTAATLAGVLVQKKRELLVFTRDRGALAGRADGAAPIAPLALEPDWEAVWDNRIALTAKESGWSVVVENGEPLLARGEERAPLAHASPQWLLKTRVQHVLGRD
jgi:tRNA(Ile)-lysidine synthase